MKKNKKFLGKLIILSVTIYAVFTITNQQKTLNQYSDNVEELKAQIAEQNEYKEELNNQKDNVNSLDFIEQTAREKLDMYFPNERIYVDRGM